MRRLIELAARPRRATRRGAALTFVLLALGCQETYGPCPEVLSVSPDLAGAGELVRVTGRELALGHADLWDDATAIPPSVRLSINPNPMMDIVAPGMSDMLVDLPAEQVALLSSTELEVALPDVAWSDIQTGLELYGVEIDPSLLPDQLPLGTTLHVRNPSGCEASWEGELTFVLVVREAVAAGEDAP